MFIVIEIQKTGDSVAIVPPTSYAESDQADAAYYAKLSAASVSSVPVHTVVMIDEYGNLIKSEPHSHSQSN